MGRIADRRFWAQHDLGMAMAGLPSGTVTFLFTDIEGCTDRWERDRQAMAAAVERHIALLDAAIQAHGGVHFKTVGDAVQAAFPTAPHAVAAAVDGQRALLAEDWGAVGPLRVRMALHAGEAIPDARGDYLAAPLNRLSRLLSAGYGEQILLSQAVQQLTRGALPPGADLRHLGEHRLRDLLEPEHVFQLLHPDLPDRFPPLKSLGSRPNNLPRQPTAFVGREAEVRQVVDLLRREEVELLTLTGPGGTGKTRLALQAAAELLEDFADGVFFVPLAPLTASDLVPSAIASALGLRDEGERPLPDRLRDFLTDKQLLLLLDNVEHVSDAASLVADLLAAAPGLEVLATSRAPLRVRAEWEYPVAPLGLPPRQIPPPEQLVQYEAVRLFVARAQAVKPDFAVDDGNAAAVAEICRRLDGLPLAIELAAARCNLLSPREIAERLDASLATLAAGPRDAPARQQTLRATIDWSYELLSEGDKACFAAFAVFAGGATVAAAETVTGAELDALDRLVAKSLLVRHPYAHAPTRLAMLETVRAHARERFAASADRDAVDERHYRYYRALVERHGSERALWGRDREQHLAQLDSDIDNLHAGLRWAVHKCDAERALAMVA